MGCFLWPKKKDMDIDQESLLVEIDFDRLWNAQHKFTNSIADGNVNDAWRLLAGTSEQILLTEAGRAR